MKHVTNGSAPVGRFARLLCDDWDTNDSRPWDQSYDFELSVVRTEKSLEVKGNLMSRSYHIRKNAFAYTFEPKTLEF